MISIGFDVSTSCVGCAVLSGEAAQTSEVVWMGHLEFKGCSNLWEKTDKFTKELLSVVSQLCHQIKNDSSEIGIFVEEACMGFQKGFSNANTITQLIRFNALCCYAVRQTLGTTPITIPAPHARKLCGIKTMMPKLCGKVIKEQVFEWALAGPLKDRQFEKTKMGKFKPCCRDEVDSWVIAAAGLEKVRLGEE